MREPRHPCPRCEFPNDLAAAWCWRCGKWVGIDYFREKWEEANVQAGYRGTIA